MYCYNIILFYFKLKLQYCKIWCKINKKIYIYNNWKWDKFN